MRHDEIGDKHVDRPVPLHCLERMFLCPGFEDCVTPLAQGLTEHRSNQFVVFDHQERFAALARRRLTFRLDWGDFRRRGRGREIDRERRSFARSRIDFDPSSRLTNQPVDGRKAEPSSLSHLFRREERLEDMRPDLLAHSGSG